MMEKDRKQQIEQLKQTLQKLITFLQYHQIKIQQIWGKQPSISVNMFSDIMEQKFGYKVGVDQFMALRKLVKTGDNLCFENFQSLGLWTNVFYQAQCKKKQKIRPHTAMNYQNKKFSNFNSKLQQSKAITHKLMDSNTSNFFKNSRFKQADELLEKKILQNALDKKWEYLIKVGQMNSWKNQSKVSERSKTVINQQKKVEQNPLKKVYKIQGQYQDIQIIQQKENGSTQVLPLKVFDQKYQSVKKKLVAQQKQKNNMKGTMLLVLDKKDKVSKTKLCERISQRDQQLNYLLLQIMRMKNIFEQQQEILTECGVNT